jgi:hypothetical protein
VKRIGPELKLRKPDLSKAKVPPVLADVYYDLRDRRLLPLIALVVVAIVAVPFLLGDSSEGLPEPAPANTAIAALKESAGKTTELTVVEAQPGLRDYRRRLRGRTATNPFHQRYTTPVLTGAKLNEPKSESSSSQSGDGGETTSTSETTAGATGGGEGGSAPSEPSGGAPADGGGSSGSGDGGGSKGGGDGAQPGPDATIYSFAVDLSIVHTSGSTAAGDKQTSEPEIREKVLPTTSLPGKKTEVVTYMGLSPKTRKPLFIVGTGVIGVFGEGACVAGGDRCQLIELETGFPEVFEYGEEGDRYKIKVTDVEFVVTGHL